MSDNIFTNHTENAPENAIETVGLCKTYAAGGSSPPIMALKDISISIPQGSFFGLLGPNGAGKSTFINILAGLVVKTSGEARVWDYDIEKDMRAARRAIGVVPQELNVDPFFTPREALDLQAGLYGVPRHKRHTKEVLAAVGLADQAEVYARRLSGGMRRRMLVAKAMVHSPPVLVLDEPTAGVDIELRKQLWSHVRHMNRNGVTILLTTHYLQEAQELCDNIAIINHGQLIACDSTASLLHRLDAKEMAVTFAEDIKAIPERLKCFNVKQLNSRQLVFCYPPSKTNSGEILSAIGDCAMSIIDLTTKEAELEDVFLNLTAKKQPDKTI